MRPEGACVRPKQRPDGRIDPERPDIEEPLMAKNDDVNAEIERVTVIAKEFTPVEA